ncbi:MAG: DUF2971 domain-containing protein [Lachnospiraceae bacterium]|nr:DUF2971 domain-containing protein [Lachnospiraceae bacterium]
MKAYRYKLAPYRNGFKWCENRINPRRQYLFHYTSMYCASQILTSGMLRFSNISNSNDILERIHDMYGGAIEESSKELKHYRQMSFTMNGKRDGFAIPAMWGHYGDKGTGVCLIFDKAVLLANLPHQSYYNKITYFGDYYSDFDSSIICGEDPKMFFKKNIDEIFFKKSEDWSYEQEFRIVHRTDHPDIPVYISIKNALNAVVIHAPKGTPDDGCVFNSPEYIALKNMIPKIPILSLGKLLTDLSLSDSNGNDHISMFR